MENNSLSLLSSNQNNVYCSIKQDDDQAKIKMYNALEKCDVLLSKCVGQEIEIKDVYIEEYYKTNDNSETKTPHYRIIIIDTNDKSYVTTSYGIRNSLGKMCGIYGLPHTWEKPVRVKVIERPLGNGKQALSLIILDNE